MEIGEIYELKENFKIDNIDDKVKLALLPNKIRIGYFSTNVDIRILAD